MNTTTRDTTIWERSAFKHLREGNPVAALLSWHLASLAQAERDEFQEIQQAALILRNRTQANGETNHDERTVF